MPDANLALGDVLEILGRRARVVRVFREDYPSHRGTCYIFDHARALLDYGRGERWWVRLRPLLEHLEAQR